LTDEITLTLPRERPFFGIAHLVLGGLAVRLDLTLEHLEDLQLALAGVLERRDAGEEAVTVSVRVEGDTLKTRVGPFDPERLRGDLDAGDGEGIGLRRLLDTVVDRAELDGPYIELTKTVR
jgi:anti-sigma regulatory factor (Ser/Thr protein kinase)